MNEILHGNSLEVLKTIKNESVDLLCTDPPYGYSFMGKAWDKALPDIGIFKECFRVLKPGAFAFVMSAPRSDVCSRMAILLEDAGFNIAFTPIYWTYASGFPKAMNTGKAIDKRLGVEDKREFSHKNPAARPSSDVPGYATSTGWATPPRPDKTHPYSEEAKALDGSYGGFQPKPAVEVVIVAMKPLSEKTYVDQALKNGKGITWLDDVRIPTENAYAESKGNEKPMDSSNDIFVVPNKFTRAAPNETGRFPANLLVEDDVLDDHSRFFSLDAWAQTLPFLAVPKASKREKNEGLEGREERQVTGGGGLTAELREDGTLETSSAGGKYGAIKSVRANFHPTVKPLKLMSYLITLGSRPGDVVLDPFVGSGTTCIAAKQLGRQYIGIERESEYHEIAEARLKAVYNTLV